MPAIAEVDLYNLALRHVGVSVEVQSTTENTTEANTCRRYYTQARDEMLNEFPWPFATVTVALALVATDPTTEWAYSYRYPVDAMRLNRILGDCRQEINATRIPYRLGKDDTGVLVYTDRVDAVVEYIAQVTDPTVFSPAFAQALAWKLAWYIAPSVTGGDPFKLGDRAYQNFIIQSEIAKNAALDEEQPDTLPDSEFILSR